MLALCNMIIMKKIFLSSLLVVLAINGFSQRIIKLNFTQPEELKVDVGNDTTINHGETVILGGETPATGGSGNYTYLWQPETGLSGTTIPNPQLTADETVTYILTVIDENGCLNIDSITIIVNSEISSVNELNENMISIYPNPNNGQFKVQLNINQPTFIELFSISGQSVGKDTYLEGGENQVSLDYSNLKKGLYLLKVTGRGVNCTKKIIIQ